MSENKDSLAYTKSSQFLLNYSWKGKSKEQIIQEMALPDYEQVYLNEAMEELAQQNKFTGMDLDQYILCRLDQEDEDIGPLHDEDIIYLNT